MFTDGNPPPKGKCRARGRINNRNNERIIGQICWNNRENDVEIWNKIFSKFF